MVRYRFPASSTLGFYVVLDTYTNKVVPGIKVHGNHLTNDDKLARFFVAECDEWILNAPTIDGLHDKIEQALKLRPR